MMGSELIRTSVIHNWFENLAYGYVRFLDSTHTDIVIANQAITGSNCYIADGKIIGLGGGYPKNIMGKVKLLAPSLLSAHNKWASDVDSHKENLQKVKQAISSIAAKAKDNHVFRNMLPDYLLKTFPSDHLMNFNRTSPDLYPGAIDSPQYQDELTTRLRYWDRNMIDMYEKVAPHINLYLAYRVL